MDRPAIHPAAASVIPDLTPGTHLCSLYQTEEEHRALVTPFLRQGLERGEKVLYIVDAHTAEAILDYLRRDGLDVEPFLARGRLGILTVQDAYMRGGRFDPDRMIALLRESTDQAVAEGYPALRVTGEMTWALRGLPGSERLIEYEAKLNRFFPGSRCLALCQYDRRRFTPEVQLDILATHPLVAVGIEIHGNPYYLAPEAFLAKDRSAARLDQWLNTLTERERTEEARRASEETFRAITDSAQDAVIMVDDEGRISYWNPAAERMFGHPSRVALGRQLHTWLVPNRYHEAYFKGIERFREVGQGPMIGRMTEATAFRADGTEFPVEVSVAAVRLKDRWHAVGIVRDVTERNRVQERLHRTNRDLRMISLCNQALIRASDEAAFLREICRILVEAGGYRAVCVCLARSDREQPAHFGFPQDEVEPARFTWTELQHREPVATALRTRRPTAACHIQRDPAFVPWREEASRLGYASLIAAPLLSGEETIGVLQVRATEPEAFDAEDVKLLAELADDTAYGVRQLRLRTERKRLSDSLIEQGRTLDAFFRHSITPLVILDKDYTFLRVNEAYAKACRRPVSEFIGRNHFDLYPSDAKPVFDEVVATKRPYRAVARPFVFPDHPEWGTTYWDWTLTPILDEAGEVESLVFSLVDVTEQQRAEEQVHLVTRALESAANGVVITDRDGTILWVNPAFTRTTGYAAEEAIGQNPRLLKSGRQDLEFYRRLWATITAGQVWRGELINKRKDGTYYHEEMTITPVKDPRGEITHFVAIKQDITARKQMESHAQRIEQLAAMGQLLGGIVHELKNPLFIVTGRVQLLNEKLANREYGQLAPDIQKIAEAAQRMGGIAQRFLTLAKPIQPSLQVCSIAAVLKGVLDFLGNELMKHRITVVTDVAADLPTGLADPAQLHQAFLNLVLNAMQAMTAAHGQGTLTVSATYVAETGREEDAAEERRGDTETGRQGEGGITASPTRRVPASAAEGGYIEVRIQDDGPGIAPEHHDLLFEPFFTTKPAGEGTGLGLWTVQNIVQAMHGTVSCETEAGKGTTFLVRLPVRS